MLNIENFPHEETENKTADVTAGQEEKLFFYLSLGLGALSGLLLIALVVFLLFHRLLSSSTVETWLLSDSYSDVLPMNYHYYFNFSSLPRRPSRKHEAHGKQVSRAESWRYESNIYIKPPVNKPNIFANQQTVQMQPISPFSSSRYSSDPE